MFVEIAVTHFADDAKIQRLREHKIPAVEIDLSKLPRDSLRDAITEAVLKTARRHWLFHPGIDAARAQQDADDIAWQKEQNRLLAAAAAKHRSRVDETASAYRQALAKPLGRDIAIPRQAELQAIGLFEYVGYEVVGFACFSERPAVWQAIILAEVFHDHCLGNALCKSVPIANHLEKRRLIQKPFLRVSSDVAEDVTAIEAQFAPAWKAVDNYLKYLLGEGVLVQQGYDVALAGTLAKPWSARTLAEKQRTAAMHSAVQDVEWILGELPANERAGMTGELWLQSIHRESGLTFRKALLSDIESPTIVGQLETIATMLKGQGPLPPATLGLPVEAAIARRKVQMATQSEERRLKQLQEANRSRQSRRDRFCADADVEKDLSGPELGAFLSTKRADMNDMSPVELAEDSEAGLTRAREALSAFVRQRRQEAEAATQKAKFQDKIADLAKGRLSHEDAIAFLKAREDDFGRMSPLQYVKDESTFQKACTKLAQWETFARRS
ncbi:MAG: hypothetical protein EOR84_23945 [Mesorhizobium sp.]|nr:MAG: hypothetical protein EOR84_23945 [Mesorhizobium sp.]